MTTITNSASQKLYTLPILITTMLVCATSLFPGWFRSNLPTAPTVISALHSRLSGLCKMQIWPCHSSLKYWVAFHYSMTCKIPNVLVHIQLPHPSPCQAPIATALQPHWTSFSSSNTFCSLLPQRLWAYSSTMLTIISSSFHLVILTYSSGVGSDVTSSWSLLPAF